MKARHPVVHYPSPMGSLRALRLTPSHLHIKKASKHKVAQPPIESIPPAIDKLPEMAVFQDKNLTLNRK